jgi:DNA-binding NarL/FixJ family response regulator
MAVRSAPNPRLLVCEYGCGRPEALRAALPEAGFEVVSCATPEILVERALQRAPDIILYKLGDACQIDAGVLRLLRRLRPRTPIAVLSGRPSLEAQRMTQEFRPIHFLLEPVDPAELVHIADASSARRAKLSSVPP